MTILAGVFSRRKHVPVPERVCESLRRVISRNPGESVVEFKGDGWYLAKVDIGVFGTPAAHSDEGRSVSMLAGEPLLLLNDGGKVRNRLQDLTLLHQAVEISDWSLLAASSGTFCGAHYDQSKRALTLFTDKIGVRPIFYWISAEYVVYASALRVLESMPEVPKCMDVRGVTEIAAFGFPLADRTAYEGIFTLRAGEVVSIRENDIAKHEYWRWDRLPPATETGQNLSQALYDRFVAAMQRRLCGERSTVAFLSGGLDSRAIVGALRGLDVAVHTINFTERETQDEVLARELAAAIGTIHHQLPKAPEGLVDFRNELYKAVRKWFESNHLTQEMVPRRDLIWSGDGGSVSLGHVYLNKEIVELAQNGNEDAAIDAFLQKNPLGVPARILQPGNSDSIVALPKRGIQEELERLECRDRGRAFHLFLMFNDQRRHLSDFFENIDVRRLEFQLPFYDSHFLEPVLTSPVNDFLGHHLYVEWLKNFSPLLTSVPWQTYPGHVPCPLPIPKDLRYQWSDDYADNATSRYLKKDLLRQADCLLKAASFPDRIIDKGRLRLAVWMTRLGLRNYDYVIKAAGVYGKYHEICNASAGDSCLSS